MRAQGNRLGLGDRVGDKAHGQARGFHLAHGLADDTGIVFRQPVFEKGVRDADGECAGVLADEAGRLEPRVEAVTVYFLFDTRQDLFPQVRFGWTVAFDPLSPGTGVISRLLFRLLIVSAGLQTFPHRSLIKQDPGGARSNN